MVPVLDYWSRYASKHRIQLCRLPTMKQGRRLTAGQVMVQAGGQNLCQITLDEMAERLLLRKIGGKYMFLHLSLRDFFAQKRFEYLDFLPLSELPYVRNKIDGMVELLEKVSQWARDDEKVVPVLELISYDIAWCIDTILDPWAWKMKDRERKKSISSFPLHGSDPSNENHQDQQYLESVYSYALDRCKDLTYFDGLLSRWKMKRLTSKQRTEINRLIGQMTQFHTTFETILTSVKKLRDSATEK